MKNKEMVMVTDWKKNVTKEEIEQLPLFAFSGQVEVIEDAACADRIAKSLRECRYLGFDTETRPVFHKGEYHKVGLLQLATSERVYLFRLNKCGLGKSLRDLLADAQVTKIGVGIRDDLRNLRKLGDFVPAAFVDLQEYVVRFGIEEKAFSKLMAIIFQVRISKRQRTSNWEVPVLNEGQIRYAATDAWGALEMYLRLSGGA